MVAHGSYRHFMAMTKWGRSFSPRDADSVARSNPGRRNLAVSGTCHGRYSTNGQRIHSWVIYIIYIYIHIIYVFNMYVYIYNLYVYIILLYNIEYWSTNHEKHSGSTNFQMPKVVISGPGFSGNIFGTIPSRGSGPVQWSKLLRLIFTPQKKQKRKGRHITVQYICMHLYTFVMCIHFYSFLSISHIQQTREKLQLKHT
jgi:hypothetical protein